MQALLTTQTDVTVSGISGIEQDAIEQPSQFLERWYAAYPHGKCLCCSPWSRSFTEQHCTLLPTGEESAGMMWWVAGAGHMSEKSPSQSADTI